MNSASMPVREHSAVGKLLRKWRTSRRMSQLELSHEAEVSARHISFVENGRAQPSREMILLLASALELPLRERNHLLHAGGFAPVYGETDLDDPSLAQVRQALNLMLQAAEPFGAVVLDRRSDILLQNQAATRWTRALIAKPAALESLGAPNLLRQLLHPAGMRAAIVNWEEVAAAVLARSMRDAELAQNEALDTLLAEVLRYPDIPENLRRFDLAEAPPLLISVHLRAAGFEARVFTTITTLGTAQDVTLQELRVETFYPADAASDAVLRALADA